eukprot:CAMPEP_0194444054 /NCGR_PEP_ID=MMETSP0176-20130528/127048_1 /TAXON_ID=216777 /ORGANISM="Proboscia alata, Strain PI-D3" /LENGTH=1220 /DNA_ID=CAMNT_0039270375 /DNA_START=20 /DNA_END=3682 /DNA_ORIENTATION=-
MSSSSRFKLSQSNLTSNTPSNYSQTPNSNTSLQKSSKSLQKSGTSLLDHHREQLSQSSNPSGLNLHESGESALLELETSLKTEIDSEFFEDPSKFRTLHRVIDVLGAQLTTQGSDGSIKTPGTDSMNLQEFHDSMHHSNPAYAALRHQQSVVEDAIEFMAVKHCADLNGSVVAVGQVSRQLSDAVEQVRTLRKQVRTIKDSIGVNVNGQGGENKQVEDEGAGGAEAKSLRELWLKKLECEAVLNLLHKLEIIRDAPQSFDALISESRSCRIGAATVVLSDAISTMFGDDVSQVQALGKVMEQLMERKQHAEQILWDTLHDVLYLRTGNSMNSLVTDGSVLRSKELSDDSGSSSDNSLFTVTSRATAYSSYKRNKSIASTTRMIPLILLKDEFDLETQELKCLEDLPANHKPTHVPIQYGYDASLNLPRYSDATAALRIITASLGKFNRIDDVERYLDESYSREIRRVSEKEQGRTYARLEKKKGLLRQTTQTRKGEMKGLSAKLPSEVSNHLKGLLAGFEKVMTRLLHLAQILRHAITSDSSIVCPSYETATSALNSVIAQVERTMQVEVREFLRSCLTNMGPTPKGGNGQVPHGDLLGGVGPSRERGIFSLGIIDADKSLGGASGAGKVDENYNSTSLFSSRASMELPVDQFVVSILFPKMNAEPGIRYALSFRRKIERWTKSIKGLKNELATCSGDYTTPIPSMEKTEGALEYLDSVIQRKLLPVLQEEAVHGTISALERNDAFSPVFNNSIYSPSSFGDHALGQQGGISDGAGGSTTTTPLCMACQALLDSTAPLFSAIHKLPKGGDLYKPLVAVLEHATLTFNSRAKQRVQQICVNKKADELLGGEAGIKDNKLSLAMEKRNSFAIFLQMYNERSGDTSDASVVENMSTDASRILPLSPSVGDTKSISRNSRRTDVSSSLADELSALTSLNEDNEYNDDVLQKELPMLQLLFQFQSHNFGKDLVISSEDDLMHAASLAHSLLKLSGLLTKRLRTKKGSSERTLSSTRALREAIGTIRLHGIRMAKFCRIDFIVQTIKHMSKICKSNTLVATDSVRLPSCVNSLGDFLMNASDFLREAGGSAIAAYSLSALEQYIPLFLMQTVRNIGKDCDTPSHVITLNGIESLDRSGSVLYRDLKTASSFEGSFWDEAVASESFERSASFVALLELDMDELEAFCRNHRNDFSDADYKLMFVMNGPRRMGNPTRYIALKQRMDQR